MRCQWHVRQKADGLTSPECQGGKLGFYTYEQYQLCKRHFDALTKQDPAQNEMHFILWNWLLENRMGYTSNVTWRHIDS